MDSFLCGVSFVSLLESCATFSWCAINIFFHIQTFSQGPSAHTKPVSHSGYDHSGHFGLRPSELKHRNRAHRWVIAQMNQQLTWGSSLIKGPFILPEISSWGWSSACPTEKIPFLEDIKHGEICRQSGLCGRMHSDNDILKMLCILNWLLFNS